MGARLRECYGRDNKRAREGAAVIRQISSGLAVSLCFVMAQAAMAPAVSAKDLKVVSERTATGFGHTESVAYDPTGHVLYVSDFGPGELKPGEKDGKGKISKVSLDGTILEEAFLPTAGQVLNRPKGIW